MSKQHSELCKSLAKHRKTHLIECSLRNQFQAKVDHTEVPIADVVSITGQFANFTMSIFEVKATRSDFLHEIKSEKWRVYLKYCHRFYFAVKGLNVCNVAEIPHEAGLTILGATGWYTPKSAPMYINEVPYETLQAMLIYKPKRKYQ